MPKPKTLPDAIDQVLTATVDLIKAETHVNGQLSLVRDTDHVIRGDRARPRPSPPSLWIFPDSARNEHTSFGLAETWEMPMAIVAVVDSDRPEQGYAQAQDLASRAGAVVLKERKLGLPDFVTDVVSALFHPSSPWDPSKDTIFAAAYVLRVKFTVFDK